MPIYEYRCDACGRRHQALLPRFDSPDPACPHCGARSLRRLVSTFATTAPEGDDGFGGDDGDFDAGDGDYGGDFGGGDSGGGDFGDDDW